MKQKYVFWFAFLWKIVALGCAYDEAATINQEILLDGTVVYAGGEDMETDHSGLMSGVYIAEDSQNTVLFCGLDGWNSGVVEANVCDDVTQPDTLEEYTVLDDALEGNQYTLFWHGSDVLSAGVIGAGEHDNVDQPQEQISLESACRTDVLKPHQDDGVNDDAQKNVDAVGKQGGADSHDDSNDQEALEPQTSSAQAQGLFEYQKSLNDFAQKDIPSEAFVSLAGSRKLDIARFLAQRRGERVTISEILTGTQLHYHERTRVQDCLKDVLGLIFSGVPIEYDKDAGSVVFLRDAKKLHTLSEKENALTLTYDVSRRYEKYTVLELAYYAHERGFWESGFSWHKGGQRRFCNYFSKTREFFGVLQFVDVRCFRASSRKRMYVWISLWPLVKDEKERHDVHYYKNRFNAEVTQSDLDVMEEFKLIKNSAEYAVFLDYISDKPVGQKKLGLSKCAQDIKNIVVSEERCLRSNLLHLCREQHSYTVSEVWKAIGELMCLEGPGVLAYDLQENVFFWDEHGRIAFPKKKDYVADLFCLTTDYPILSNRIVHCILQQRGFKVASLSEVTHAKQCLDVLGLAFAEKKKLILKDERKITNYLIQGDTTSAEKEAEKCGIDWQIRFCRRVASWTQTSCMIDLWESYLERKHIVRAHVPEGISSRGLKRRCTQRCAPEDIIFQEIPALYDWLRIRGVWEAVPADKTP